MPGARNNPETGLTEKQEKFCVLYVTGGENADSNLVGNGTACYRATFNPKRAKDKTINEKASRLLAGSKIQARLTALRDSVAEKAVITQAEVLKIAASLARAKLSDFYDEAGNIKPPSQWTDEMKFAAASLKTFEEYEGRGENSELSGSVRELKLWDKNAALERLFKYFGMFEKDNHQKPNPIKELLDFVAKNGKPLPIRHNP